LAGEEQLAQEPLSILHSKVHGPEVQENPKLALAELEATGGLEVMVVSGGFAATVQT
jgi:hypothetical protein